MPAPCSSLRPALVVNGDLQGGVRTSEFQRTAATRPLGGRLVVGLPDGSAGDLPDYRAPAINFTNTIVPVVRDSRAAPAGHLAAPGTPHPLPDRGRIYPDRAVQQRRDQRRS